MKEPRVFRLDPDAPDPAALTEAADMLRRGGLVAFPTETVYGLAADATNPVAIDRLNRVKGRPPDKPYSLHLHSASQARDLVPEVPPLAKQLMERFWPGPLTIVMTSGDNRTVGMRVPGNALARAFLRACGVPVVAPSANVSGALPPTDAQQVLVGLDGSFDCLLDAGATQLGRESTVVEVIDERLEIRREGAISKGEILSIVGARPASPS